MIGTFLDYIFIIAAILGIIGGLIRLWEVFFPQKGKLKLNFKIID